VKFTAQGNISISAQVIKKKDDNDDNNNIIINALEKDNTVIGIKDSGIDHERMPRLFTKFATKSFQGTGLGLFISKSIVEGHGGKIWAQNNKEGRGTTFYFIKQIDTLDDRASEAVGYL
jgi:signal transduction histidine kinase